MTSYTGRCLCGAVTWRATAEPVRVGWCHCTMCRRHTGAPAAAFLMVPKDAFTVQGPVGAYRSSPGAERCFCTSCGSPVYGVWDADATIDVYLGTADDPARFAPTYELFTEVAVAWVPRQPHIRRYDRERDGPFTDPDPSAEG